MILECELAKQDKESAVRQARDTAKKNTRLLRNITDIARAKINAVQKAAQETPEKSVREVWDVASKVEPERKSIAGSSWSTSSAAAGSDNAASYNVQSNLPAAAVAHLPISQAHENVVRQTDDQERSSVSVESSTESFSNSSAAHAEGSTPATSGPTS